MKHTRDRSPDRAEDRAELSHALHDLSTVERWAERANGDVPAPPDVAQDQEAPQGPEFSVETETVNGMHSVARIAAHPADRDAVAGGGEAAAAGEEGAAVALDESARAAVRSLVRSLLDLAGHESGPARTRVVMTAAGPRVVGCSLGE
ncbi:hypothetical protein [Streptomyces sp. NPDC005485]|uniref:hypothetical protein n=1 Tax=Streptomyces sp. NPDC005485 TaxID=3155591 RepID=UPI0033A26F66